MTKYICTICGYLYDEEKEGVAWDKLPDDWCCPVCGADKSDFKIQNKTTGASRVVATPKAKSIGNDISLKSSDKIVTEMSDIRAMSESCESIIEPMRTKKMFSDGEMFSLKALSLQKYRLTRMSL